MILTDTCILIEYFKNNLEVKQVIENVNDQSFVLNSIIVMELVSGARNKVELNSIKRRLNKFQVIEINQDILDEAGSLIETFNLSHGLKIPDAVIAATAKYYNIPLYTHNQKDFRFIENLELF